MQGLEPNSYACVFRHLWFHTSLEPLNVTSFVWVSCLDEWVSSNEEEPLIFPITNNLSYFHRDRDKFRTGLVPPRLYEFCQPVWSMQDSIKVVQLWWVDPGWNTAENTHSLFPHIFHTLSPPLASAQISLQTTGNYSSIFFWEVKG